MGIDVKTYAAAKKYTDNTVEGGGAIKGKNATIDSITDITGGHRVTFKWTLDDGTEETDTMDVMDGVDGQDGSDGATPTCTVEEITGGHRVTFTIDGTDETFDVMDGEKGDKGDKGDNAQVTELPEASESEEGKIYQYVGETTASLINGYFYKCVEDSGVYSWVEKSVQSGGGSGGTSDYTELSNKPQIGGTTLIGNKTLAELGIAADSDLAGKVDKVTGKDLSTNDYTNEDKAIVGGVTAALADKVDKVSGKGLSANDYTNEDKAIVGGVTAALADKVDKVTGKSLSTNDYTNEAKTAVDALGTASTKDSTTYINPGNNDIPTADAVYTAMTSMLEGAFHPKGNKTVAELVPALLIQANVGNVYKITDSGVTDANWVGGAGQTITAGQMAVVVFGNEPNTFLFNLENGINIDMSLYQTKAITPITVDGQQKTNVEDAVDAINDLAGSNKTAIGNIKDGVSIDSFGDVETALAGKADASDVPTKTSDLTNDSHFRAIFTGTQLEWDAVVDKSVYEIVNITDDSETGTTTNQVTDGDVRAVSSGAVYDALALKANLTAISNPNLLDNPWFTVNQRGLSSYTGGSVEKQYTFDRWHLSWASADVSVTRNSDGSITYANNSSSNNVQLIQILGDNYLNDKDGTLSVDVVNYTGTIKFALCLNSSPWTETLRLTVSKIGINTNTAHVSDMGDNQRKCYFALSANSSITFRSTKLELGTVSTLAMDTAPNYATELLKCQRYFQLVGKTATIGVGKQVSVSMAHSTTDIWFPVSLPVPLRVSPSIEKKTGTWMITQSGSTSPITVSPTLNIAGTDTTDVAELNISAVTTSAEPMTIGQVYKLATKAEAGQALIFLSADL